MNFQDMTAEVMSYGVSDDFKCFLLGIGMAFGIRLTRAGIRWLKRIDD